MTVLTHAHGGDLDAIQRTYGIPKEEIIDFSGNINPLGFPKRAEDALKENLHLICTYPDKKYKALKQAIGTYTGADPSHIVVGNGSTELISTFTRRCMQSIPSSWGLPIPNMKERFLWAAANLNIFP